MQYGSRQCQVDHYPQHKSVCKRVQRGGQPKSKPKVPHQFQCDVCDKQYDGGTTSASTQRHPKYSGKYFVCETCEGKGKSAKDATMRGRFAIPHEQAGRVGMVSSSGEMYMATPEEHAEFKAGDNTDEALDEFVRRKLAEQSS